MCLGRLLLLSSPEEANSQHQSFEFVRARAIIFHDRSDAEKRNKAREEEQRTQ